MADGKDPKVTNIRKFELETAPLLETGEVAACLGSENPTSELERKLELQKAEASKAIELLDEAADVLNLARVLVGQCSGDLTDDFSVRNSLCSMLDRAYRRAGRARG